MNGDWIFFSFRKECISNKTNPNHKKALDMKICPYNSSHHVNKKEMDQHVQDCASAALFKDANANLDDFVNLKITTETAKKESSSIEKAKTSGEEEDWDKEMSGVEWTSYDPMKKVLENNFAVNSKCRNQTERRDIRTMQRIGDKEGLTYLLADGDSINSGPGKKQLPVGMSSKQRK